MGRKKIYLPEKCFLTISGKCGIMLKCDDDNAERD